MIHPSIARPLALMAVLVGAATGITHATEVSIVGTSHLASLKPNVAQTEAVVGQLTRFKPSLICIEAMPGDRIEALLRSPEQFGDLLSGFAPDAVRLGPEQQARLSLSASAARRKARSLEDRDTLSAAEQIELIGLELAAFEPGSALLNWSTLDPEHYDDAGSALGSHTVEQLKTLMQSRNERVTLAIPLARKMGHKRLCNVDAFVDELGVMELAEQLMPLVQMDEVQARIDAFNVEEAKHWHADLDDGLIERLRWENSADFASADRDTQWQLFVPAKPGTHDAGQRRLMFWHARNGEITTGLLRAMAAKDGQKIMLIIGASHRPFIEANLRALPWITVVPAETLLQ